MPDDGLAGRRSSRIRRAAHLGLAGLAVAAIGLWLSYLWINRGDPGAWQRDWYCFYSAGAVFLESGPDAVYRQQCIEHYFWLYPPYMLYPYALAALLPPLAWYGLAVVGVIAATLTSLVLLSRSLPNPPAFESVALATLGSALFFATVATGQHSAVLLLGLAGSVWAMHRERRFQAGLWLGLLGIKPNWAVIVVALLLVTRRWRVLGGMATVGAAMVASTLPLGLDVWGEYLRWAPHHVAVLLDPGLGGYDYPAHKLATLEAYSRSTIGVVIPALHPLTWWVLEALILGLCVHTWLRRSEFTDQLAITVLVMVAANLYVEFYDVLVVAIPAAIWATTRERYPPSAWKLAGGAIAALWAWYWLWTLASPGPEWPALAGGILGVWILAEAQRAVLGAPDAAAPAAPAGT